MPTTPRAPAPPIPVFLARVPAYDAPWLADEAARLLELCGALPAPGARVLVKPNLVSQKNAGLSTTHPAVVRAVCACLADCGARITVADSPAFGTARGVARASGLARALDGLPVRLASLGRPHRLALSFGAHVGVSRDALEAERIISVPRLKAHDQMRLTAGVKNLFGCVVGGRKAFAHCRFGDRGNRFEAMLVEVAAALPPVVTLLDGVVAMSGHGPTGGDACPLGLLAASRDPHALDAAVYAMLGVEPDDAAVWREARARGLPGAFAENIAFPLLGPADFDLSAFVVPPRLDPVTFDPFRLIKGRIKSFCHRLPPGLRPGRRDRRGPAD
ncbi:protein of unknown function DUF362 [Desulfovibrio sp. X2]|uniref:DUF362 domain-containing protein n=1 Tax=Desulfovibrio sp. X2 TaxID=941449 RepID=UPI0003587D55|nr:DUF362 domain-containing protein [Desulfovibrio sp. X2]EPR44319.1 protein of unknown function DUF362 [Desulfovibrio sp. X2]